MFSTSWKKTNISSELYGCWWKVINDELGKIIEESEASGNNESGQILNNKEGNTTNAKNQQERSDKLSSLTREEERNLSDYLNISMTISKAKAAFQKEAEAAEMRQNLRDNNRALLRGNLCLGLKKIHCV